MDLLDFAIDPPRLKTLLLILTVSALGTWGLVRWMDASFDSAEAGRNRRTMEAQIETKRESRKLREGQKAKGADVK